MASLQCRHSRGCPLYPWAPASKTETCTCKPVYHVVVREGRKVHRTRVGRDRRAAERAQRKIGSEVDEGSYQPQKAIRFDTFADQWLASLECKENTRRSYVSTLDAAKEAFGEKNVRRLGLGDIHRFKDVLQRRGSSASTRAKHLRVLGACLSSAVAHGYAGKNPVQGLPKGEKPTPTRKEAAYFENDELPILFKELTPGVYRTVCEVALKTGMRQGELIALTWSDVKLGDSLIHVRHSYSRADGLTTPKSKESRRKVDLTEDVVALLGEWWGKCGRPSDGKLVFPGESKSGYLVSSTITRRELYPAMERAGIPRVGPTGELRTFHSFRHTFAKRALENGAQIAWLSRHLGHSTVQVTTEVYGHFESAERKVQVEKLAGAFGF